MDVSLFILQRNQWREKGKKVPEINAERLSMTFMARSLPLLIYFKQKCSIKRRQVYLNIMIIINIHNSF